MLGPWDVNKRAPQQIKSPIIVVLSGPTRWYTFATIGLKSPLPTIAIEPARAVEKKYINKNFQWER